jgi:hypothetical protein
MSLNEIHKETGVPKGTLSNWLTGYTLTPEERREKNNRARKYGPRKHLGDPSRWKTLVGEKTLSGHTKGKVAEAAVLFRLVLHSFEVYGSVFDGDSADWVVKNPTGKLLKLQVKWASRGKHGVPFARVAKMAGHSHKVPYQEGDFDFLVAYCLHTDSCYIWSFEEVYGMSSISIRDEAKEAWQKLL